VWLSAAYLPFLPWAGPPSDPGVDTRCPRGGEDGGLAILGTEPTLTTGRGACDGGMRPVAAAWYAKAEAKVEAPKAEAKVEAKAGATQTNAPLKAEQTKAAPKELPKTGGDILPIVGVAGALLVGGGLLIRKLSQ
jgi:LPXTG-motif cell wall-anchored protein